MQTASDLAQNTVDAIKTKLNVKDGSGAQGTDTAETADQRAYPAPADQSEEAPGKEQATLPLSQDAGVESLGAKADEDKQATGDSLQSRPIDVSDASFTGAASLRADDGDNAEGAATETTGKEPTKTSTASESTEEKSTSSGGGVGKLISNLGNMIGNIIGVKGDKSEQQDEASKEVSDQQQVATGGAGDQAAGEARGAPVPQKHEEVLHAQEDAGKIFTVEPVLPGGGVTVHGMLPAPILMHTAENTKRTGGSPSAAVAGVPDPEESTAFEVQDKMNVLEPKLPDVPVTPAMVLDAEVPAPDADVTA